MFNFFKKSRQEKAQLVEEAVSQWNLPLEARKIQPDLAENISLSRQLFADMDVIRYRTLAPEPGGSPRYFLIFCEGLVNPEVINDNVVRPLMQAAGAGAEHLGELVSVGAVKRVDSLCQVVEAVTAGDTVLFAEGSAEALILDTRLWVLRPIEEPDNEKTLVGPREGFNESLTQNLAQVIRRVHSSELKTKMLTLGRRTKTPVCVCYFDSLVDKAILADLMGRLGQIDIDGVLDTNYINELIRDRNYSPFRITGYTERPDTVVGKLLEGRIAIFLEGTPMVLTVPYLFIENFQSSEDYYLSCYYTSFSRFIRICSFLLSISIPGLYIAVVAFHQEMMPLQILIQIALERQSVPLPAALEAVLMLLVFDVLRETGVRMPSKIGQALSIVGALVIGQAAVEASLVASPMIIVVASTGITSLLVPKLNAPVILWRFILLFFATSFGFFGFTIGLSLMLIHINNLTSFGVEQVTLTGTFRFQNIKDLVFRAPWTRMEERPGSLTENLTRLSGGDDHA